VLYISIPYATAVHKCCCGCGEKVVTPLTPTDWKLIFDGESVSLSPSIGNWSFRCESHYWIRSNNVHWAVHWSRQQIEVGRRRDRWAKERQYGEAHDRAAVEDRPQETGLLRRFLNWFRPNSN
jgi:hypothetical protein